MTQRTKKLKRTKNFTYFLSMALCLGVFLFMLIYGALKGIPKFTNGMVEIRLKDTAYMFMVSGLIIAGLFLLVKEKLRNTLYMLSLAYSMLLFHTTGAYIVLAIWGLDEYVIYNIHKNAKNKFIINKEIDLRDE